jgi:hypothetical protein
MKFTYFQSPLPAFCIARAISFTINFEMESIGKILLIVGGVIVLFGLLILFSSHIPFLGKLPGDIIIKRDNFTFYFPIVTFLIVSVVLSIIISIIIRFTGK